MFGGIRIGRLAGIPFYINPSWFLVFGLVTFSLATTELPLLIPERSPWVYWVLALGSALLFFGSLVAHEMGHSLVSRAYGVPVRSITLHLFGGVAALGKEVRKAREEFLIAVAGPLVSVGLAAVFFGLGLLIERRLTVVAAGLELVGFLNASVAVFNLVPGFPLDGGRILRSVVWGLTGNYRRSTRVASLAGRLIGLLMIVAGIYLAITQRSVGSLWLSLIGWFLVSMARQSYSQAVMHDHLQSTAVAALAVRPLRVPADLTLDELFAGYIRTTGWKFYLATVHDEPVGLVTAHHLASTPQSLWPATPLFSVMLPIAVLPQVDPSATADTALALLEESGAQLVRVVENGETTGIVGRDRLVALAFHGAGR